MIALKIIAALNHSNRALTLRELSKQINEPDLQILKELLVLHKKDMLYLIVVPLQNDIDSSTFYTLRHRPENI